MFNMQDFITKLKEEVMNELNGCLEDLKDECDDFEDEFDDFPLVNSNFTGWSKNVVTNDNQKFTKIVSDKEGDSMINNNNQKFSIVIKKEWSTWFPYGRLITIGCLGLVKLILLFCKDSIIIASGISRYKFMMNTLSFLIGIIFVSIIVRVINYIKFSKSKKIVSKPKKEVSLNIKKNISKDDLKVKLNDLLNEWYDTSGETGKSYPYIEQALRQLKDIETIQSTLSLLVDNNEESSLEEVFNVIKTTEEQVIRNIVSMINHIKVELSIEGYDSTHIEGYLNSNETLIKNCSSLLKTALLYMDGKADSKGIEEYIKSMVETLNRLKKEG